MICGICGSEMQETTFAGQRWYLCPVCGCWEEWE